MSHNESESTAHQPGETAEILAALEEGRNKRVRKRLRHMHPAKVAGLLEALAPGQRLAVWQQVDGQAEARVLAHLDAELARHLGRDGHDGVQETEGEAAAHDPSTRMQAVREALAGGRLKRVGKLLQRMHPAKVAGLLESLPPDERRAAWSMVDTERAGKVLTYLHGEICTALAAELEHEELFAAVQGLELDDLVDLIQALPPALGHGLLHATAGERRVRLESMLSYPEDSAGGIMNADPIVVRADVKLNTVLRYLRLLDRLPAQTDMLMVVDREGHYQGVLRLATMLTAEPGARVSELMETDLAPIPVTLPAAGVARQFQDLDLLSAPVVDAEGVLLGRITVDDVVDLIREDSDRAVMQRAGLDGEADMFAPVLVSSRRRAVWLGINLLTAFLAAWVIGQFEGTLQQLVALAVLMPIVASMGGIAGSQTLTLVIRGLALGQIQRGNARLLLSREVGISVLNGLLWALVVALLAVLWFDHWGIGAVIAAAILINLLVAALAGLAIPLLLDRFGIDPALAGSVILTTVTDVVGFFAFLGLATVLLL